MPVALLLPLLFAFTAQQLNITFDAASTTVRWTLTGNVHTVHGTFKLLSGSAQMDAATGVGSGELVVNAVSGESGNGTRDKNMHKDVLESAKFPKITFVPKTLRGKLEMQGTSHVEIDGTITLHGAAHPITIPADVAATAKEVKVTAHFEIPYVEWGLKNPSTFLFKVDPKVGVEFETTGHIAFGR